MLTFFLRWWKFGNLFILLQLRELDSFIKMWLNIIIEIHILLGQARLKTKSLRKITSPVNKFFEEIIILIIITYIEVVPAFHYLLKSDLRFKELLWTKFIIFLLVFVFKFLWAYF
jgi:hypothetical protein